MIGDDRRLYLVLYDIAKPKRWRRVYALLRAAGAWTQYSAFFCRLPPARMTELEGRIAASLDLSADRLLVVDLGDSITAPARLRPLGRAELPPLPAPYVVI